MKISIFLVSRERVQSVSSFLSNFSLQFLLSKNLIFRFHAEREKLSLLKKKLVDRWCRLPSLLLLLACGTFFSFFLLRWPFRFLLDTHSQNPFLLYLISHFGHGLVLQVKVIFVFPTWLLLQRVFCCLMPASILMMVSENYRRDEGKGQCGRKFVNVFGTFSVKDSNKVSSSNLGKIMQN